MNTDLERVKKPIFKVRRNLHTEMGKIDRPMGTAFWKLAD